MDLGVLVDIERERKEENIVVDDRKELNCTMVPQLDQGVTVQPDRNNEIDEDEIDNEEMTEMVERALIFMDS